MAMPARPPSDWRELAAAEAALTDGGPGARTHSTMRSFLQLVRRRVRDAKAYAHLQER